MPPRRFRMMAQRNVIRRDCASQKNLLPNDVWLSEEKFVADRSEETVEAKGCEQGMSQRGGGVLWMELFSP